MSTEDAIIKAIQSASKDGLSGVQIAKAIGGWRSWNLYPALDRLERAGKLKGAWVDGPWPRRRLYQLVNRFLSEDGFGG